MSDVCPLIPSNPLVRCEVVPRLPKTRSGKILRKELAKIAGGLPYAVPPTIEDAAVLPVLEAILGPRRARPETCGSKEFFHQQMFF